MRKQILGLFLLLLAGVLYAGEVEVPRLSPLPERVMEERVPLSGQWWFNPAPEAEFWEKEMVKHWKPIEVPGEWVMQGFEVEKGRAAGYFRTFTVPASWQGKRIKLRCNAIYSDAQVYINGQKAGSHLGGFTAFELDVTDWVRCGAENRMAVAVTSETVADSTSNASRYAVHPLGGISRDLYLFALPETNLSLFHVSTVFDSTYTDATLVAVPDTTGEMVLDNAMAVTPIDTAAVAALLGLDPLYVANEGVMVVFLPEEYAEDALYILKKDRHGKNAAIVGEVLDNQDGEVYIKTIIGTERILPPLVNEQFPRIC